jgi:hypothetical protein
MAEHTTAGRTATRSLGRVALVLSPLIILASATIWATWPVAVAADDGKLVTREQRWDARAKGAAVICHYQNAGGTFAITEFSEHPEAVTCAPSASAAARPLAGNHWAAPLPTDKTVAIECRFLPALADDGSGLGTRFGTNAPLRLKANFNAWQLALTGNDDRTALGEADLSIRGWARFSHGTALRDPPKPLTLTISPDDGLATLMLRLADGKIPWSRPGGCRPGEGVELLAPGSGQGARR